MNKKFSTLVAGVLLASGVGASAQTFNPQVFSSEPEIRQAKYYALGVGSGATNVVSVTETADGTLAFKSVAANSLNSLAKVDSALWTVSANVTGDGGATRFVMTNKATGATFSFDPKNAVKETGTSTSAVSGNAAEVGGALTQWIWYNSRYNVSNSLQASEVVSMDFAGGDSTLVIRVDAATNVIYAAKDSKQKLQSGTALQILTPGSWVMSAEDLNTKGDDVKYMQLSFAEDIDKNPFADKYQAQVLRSSGTPSSPYEVLRNKKGGYTPAQDEYLFLNKLNDEGELSYNYLRLDTSYYESTGASFKLYNQLTTSAAIMEKDAAGNLVTPVNGYNVIDTLGYNLPDDAFRFKFTKDLLTDSLQVESFSQFVELANAVAPKSQKGSEVTYWTMLNDDARVDGGISGSMATGFKPGVQNNTKLFTVLSHCTLVDEAKNVVTFYDDDVLAGRPVENHVNLLAYADGIDSDYASIADGVYTIKNVKTGEYYGVHIYDADSVAEYTGGDVIKNMNFNHIPAFQWVVIKKDHSALRAEISPVQVTNREFDAQNDYQIQLRKGTKDGQYKLNGVEVVFEPVSADAVADKHNGYKFLEDQDLDVNRYTFNYWHAYTADKYLNKNAEDSVLNVLTEDAGRFSIEAAQAAEFGYDVDARGANTYIPTLAQLERRLYTVSAPYGRKLYVNKEHQIMATTNPASTDAVTSFYFKENNEFTKG